MIRISQWRESHCRTNISVRSMELIQKSRTMRITVWYSSRKVNHLVKVIWNRNIITEFTRLISSTRIGKPVLLIDVKVSQDKNINRWVDQENLIYVRWNRIKKPCIKTEKVIDRGKRCKTRSEVKPVENISKNLQSLLEISRVQKEVFLKHKLEDHAYDSILLE